MIENISTGKCHLLTVSQQEFSFFLRFLVALRKLLFAFIKLVIEENVKSDGESFCVEMEFFSKKNEILYY